MNKKIVLFLLGEKGFSVLKGIINKYSNSIFEAVVYGIDKNIENDYSNEITALCKKNNIVVYERCSVPSLNEFNVNIYQFAVGWRWIIPGVDKLIVLHDSLLPKYRGFAPLVNALINGEREIGVSAIFASSEYDKGDIIAQEKMIVNYPIKISTAITEIAKLYLICILKIIHTILNADLFGITQDESLSTYSLWRGDSDYLVNWNKDSREIQRFIDSVGSPYRGAMTSDNKMTYLIKNSVIVNDVVIESRIDHIGKVIFMDNMYPIVICGKGLLKILELSSLDGRNMLGLIAFRTRFTSREIVYDR